MINAIFANFLGIVVAGILVILVRYGLNLPWEIVIRDIFMMFMGACSVWIGLYRDGKGW